MKNYNKIIKEIRKEMVEVVNSHAAGKPRIIWKLIPGVYRTDEGGYTDGFQIQTHLSHYPKKLRATRLLTSEHSTKELRQAVMREVLADCLPI